MTMMIGRFHKLIQSRIVWLVILVFIVIAFVFWGMGGLARKGMEIEARSVGKLHGKEVSTEKFRNAYANSYLGVAIMLGQPLRVTDEVDKELRTAAWRRMIALETADNLGLTASDQEVVMTIRGQPVFMQDGRFNPAMYNAFVTRFLRALGVNEMGFEDFMRQEIRIRKVRNLVDQGILISPYEMQRAFGTVSDAFDIEFVELSQEDVEEDVKVTDEEVREFFDADPEAFMLPPSVKVKYVRFPVEEYTEETAVSEEDALAYYNDHLQDYTIISLTTNVMDDASGEGPVKAATRVEKEEITTPFEDVQEEIVESIRKNNARLAAAATATEFVMELAPGRDDTAPSFEEVAAEYELPIENTDYFTLGEEMEDVDAGIMFNRDAFELLPNPDDYFSNAIMGEDYVYVLALEDRREARLPDFDEVEEDVREAAQAAAIEDTLSETAEEIRSKVSEGDASFSEVAAEYDLTPTVITNVTAIAGFEDEELEEYGQYILPAALVANAGEVSKPIEMDDKVIIAYIADRVPGDPTTFSALKPEILEALKRERGQAMFTEWQDFRLREANFEDLWARRAEQAAEEEVGEEDQGEEY